MPSNRRLLSLTGLLSLTFWLTPPPLLAADLMILFTTPQERQIINTNRYKTDEPKPVEVDEPEIEIDLPMQMITMEEVAASYTVSGITLSNDGSHSVWINKTYYEDGAQLEAPGAELAQVRPVDTQLHRCVHWRSLNKITHQDPCIRELRRKFCLQVRNQTGGRVLGRGRRCCYCGGWYWLLGCGVRQ